MQVTGSTVYRGLNVYAPAPVIRLTVDLGPVKDWSTSGLGVDFVDALFQHLPELKEPNAAGGWPGSSQVLLQGEGLGLAHVAAQTALALQNRAGARLHVAQSGPAGRKGVFHVVYEYEDVRLGREAGHLAIDLIHHLLQTRMRPPGTQLTGFDFAQRCQTLVELGQFRHRPVQDAAVVEAAHARGIEVIKIRNRIIQLGQGCFQSRLSGSKTTHTNVIATSLSSNKALANRLFREVGLPVAVQWKVNSVKAAVKAAERIGYPVVIKPITGNLGRGVTVSVGDAAQVKAAYERARPLSTAVLVEQFIPGTDYRLLVINGALIAASKRVPAHVAGDGIQSIEELVEEANRDPRRGSKSLSMWTALELDERAHRILSEQGYEPKSIPGLGETVYLRDVANTSAGGTAVDVTDDVHPDNRAMAVRAAMVVGLDVVGVDFLTTDIARSYREIGGAICEINSKPGLRKHMWPAQGKPREVVGPILDMLFPPGTPVTIPIALITDGDGSAATSRLVANTLNHAGHSVGIANGEGIEIGGMNTVAGLLTPPAAARTILLDPTVDAAVLELSADAILRYGLGLHNYRVGAVLSGGGRSDREPNSFKKSPFDGRRLVLHGAQHLAVVNADDEETPALIQGLAADRVCLVTTRPDQALVRAQIAANGPAVVANGEATPPSITVYDKGNQVAELSMPATEGAPALGSAAFAVAIAYGLGASQDNIRQGLSVF